MLRKFLDKLFGIERIEPGKHPSDYKPHPWPPPPPLKNKVVYGENFISVDPNVAVENSKETSDKIQKLWNEYIPSKIRDTKDRKWQSAGIYVHETDCLNWTSATITINLSPELLKNSSKAEIKELIIKEALLSSRHLWEE